MLDTARVKEDVVILHGFLFLAKTGAERVKLQLHPICVGIRLTNYSNEQFSSCDLVSGVSSSLRGQ